MSSFGRGGTRTTKVEDFERYFIEIVLSNFESLKKQDFILTELMLRTMAEQLVDDGKILGLDEIDFDKEKERVTLKIRLPIDPIKTVSYLPMEATALEISWKNLTAEQIANRKCEKPQDKGKS